MEIRILEKSEQHTLYPAVYEMLTAADGEFVPPLSARSSSTQQRFTQSTRGDSIARYFAQLKQQRFAAVYENGAVIGFVSFIENYTCDVIGQDQLPNIYLSTLVVRPESRGKGITTALYRKLFAEYEKVNIFTRTWSTNAAHIRILQRYQFETVRVLKNDRGNGIDTVYFKKAHK